MDDFNHNSVNQQRKLGYMNHETLSIGTGYYIFVRRQYQVAQLDGYVIGTPYYTPYTE